MVLVPTRRLTDRETGQQDLWVIHDDITSGRLIDTVSL
jgi:hypothetical protein